MIRTTPPNSKLPKKKKRATIPPSAKLPKYSLSKKKKRKRHRTVGRPTKYHSDFARQVYMFALLGATKEQIAEFFEVTCPTIGLWKKEHPEFSAAMQRGKLWADANVAGKLYERALGYEHPEEKIFCQDGQIIRAETRKHYPPETAAMSLWLKNRQREIWGEMPDQKNQDVTAQPVIVTINVDQPDDNDAS